MNYIIVHYYIRVRNFPDHYISGTTTLKFGYSSSNPYAFYGKKGELKLICRKPNSAKFYER